MVETVIYALLAHFEMVHFHDLNKGAGLERLPAEASDSQKRERVIVALESVLPQERVREVVGTDDVWVDARGLSSERWRRL